MPSDHVQTWLMSILCGLSYVYIHPICHKVEKIVCCEVFLVHTRKKTPEKTSISFGWLAVAVCMPKYHEKNGISYLKWTLGIQPRIII